MKLGTKNSPGSREGVEAKTVLSGNSEALSPPKGLGTRRRRPALIVVSVLLVVVCALGGAAVIARGDESKAVLALNKSVAQGEIVDADDLREVQWKPTDSISTVSAADRSKIVGKHASTDLRANTLLTLDQVTETVALQPGQVTVGVALTPEQMPLRALVPGQRIQLVSTPAKGGDIPLGAPPQIEATVVQVGTRDERSGRSVVEVAVSPVDGPVLAARAFTERINVVARQMGPNR